MEGGRECMIVAHQMHPSRKQGLYRSIGFQMLERIQRSDCRWLGILSANFHA